MERLLVLNLGNGNSQTGLPSIIVQLWDETTAQPMQIAGSLPEMPELARLMGQWQSLYFALYAHLGWRRTNLMIQTISPIFLRQNLNRFVSSYKYV
jgi:hypothetical protein